MNDLNPLTAGELRRSFQDIPKDLREANQPFSIRVWRKLRPIGRPRMLSVVLLEALLAGVALSAPAPQANSIGIQMVDVPGGSFTMGSTQGDFDEQPPHKVTLSPFRMSAGEVTLDQYRAFRSAHALKAPSGAVTGVSWYDAIAFCQ